MVTGLSKPLDHNEPFKFESDNKTAEAGKPGSRFRKNAPVLQAISTSLVKIGGHKI
jgi:hypothetical protein